MAESTVTDKRTMPYIPLATLTNFFGKLKKTVVPPVIDASLTRNMSGGMSGALTSALKFLGLIDQAGKVLPSLKDLVAAYETDEWKPAFGKLVQAAYAPIVEGIDLSTATAGQLEEQFRTKGRVEGQMTEKSVRFYLAALGEAGTTLSPHFKARKARGSNGVRKAAKKAPAAKKDQDDDHEDHPDAHDTQRFEIPIPHKAAAKVIVPKNLTAEDWAMLKTILEAYIGRLVEKP